MGTATATLDRPTTREESRARVIRAQEEASWRELERIRRGEAIRAERTGIRAARFVSAAE